MSEARKPSVFVLDDEGIIASTLTVILNLSGFIARAFTDPLEALEAAETKCPDFLITDVVMPTLSGIDLCIKFNALHPDCKVLLFSGQSVTSDLLLSAREQGHDFEVLPKPLHPTVLLSSLAYHAGFLDVR